ncbi:MAG: hypothetical protein AAGD04_12040 [Pseudomonadota bacterium]
MAARSGRVTYIGTGFARVVASYDSYFAIAVGDASVEVDFSSQTASGELALKEITASRVGNIAINDTTVIFEPTYLDANYFALDLTLDPTDFGLTNFDQQTGRAIFYGAGPTSVAGVASGTGASATGPTGLLLLDFAAE